MASMAGTLRMTWEQRKEKIDEVIAFLSAWDISRGDAQAIFADGYQKIKEMSVEDFIKRGEQMRGFINLMRGIAPNPIIEDSGNDD